MSSYLHLDFEPLDRKICEVLHLASKDKAIGTFFDHFDDVIAAPSSSEILAAFLGKDVQTLRPRLKLDAALLKSGIVYQVSRDFDNVIITDRITYHLHSKINESLDNQEYDIEATTARLIGPAVLPDTEWQDFEHIKADAETAANIIRGGLRQSAQGINILIYGDTGTGKTEFCKALAAHLGLPLHAVGEKTDSLEEEFDGTEGVRPMTSPAARLADKRLVENMLGRRQAQALTMFDEMEDVLGNEQIKTAGRGHSSFVLSKAASNNLLTQNDIPCLWTTNNIERFDRALLRRFAFTIEMKTPNASVRRRVIARTLLRYGKTLTDTQIQELADQNTVPPAFFSRAVASAVIATHGDSAADTQAFSSSLTQVLRSISKVVTGRETVVSPRPVERYDLNLVNTDVDLRDLVDKIIDKNIRRFSLCGYGVSGAGKSEFLVYLATKMGLDAMLVRYSDVGSSYVSETEANIRRSFEQAADEKKFLIIDEADSILGDRRYANQSWERSTVNEMLICMEKHPAPFGCTTNLMDEIDQASLRRFTFKVRFMGLPLEKARKAFEIYFGQTPPPHAYFSDTITPGDFAIVLKQADIMEKMHDTDWLIAALKKECDAKKVAQRPMGFHSMQQTKIKFTQSD